MKVSKLKDTQLLIEGDEIANLDLRVHSKTGLASSEFDNVYESLLLMYRFPGMDASKQLFYGDTISILTLLSSSLQNLLEYNILTEEQLDDVINSVKSIRKETRGN